MSSWKLKEVAENDEEDKDVAEVFSNLSSNEEPSISMADDV